MALGGELLWRAAVDVGWWREVGRKRRSVDGRWKLSMPFASYVSAFFFFFFIIFGGLEFFPEPELLDFYPVLFFLFFTLPPPPPHTYPQPKDTICSPTSVAIHSFICPPFPICTEIFSREREERISRYISLGNWLCPNTIWSNSQSDWLWLIKHCFLSKLFFIFRWLKGFFPPQRRISLVQTDGLLLLFGGVPTTPQRRRPSCHRQIFWLTLNKSPNLKKKAEKNYKWNVTEASSSNINRANFLLWSPLMMWHPSFFQTHQIFFLGGGGILFISRFAIDTMYHVDIKCLFFFFFPFSAVSTPPYLF